MVKRWRSGLAAAVVGLIMVAVTDTSASASGGPVDQSQTAVADNIASLGRGFSWVQTITAGRTGLLDQVDLLLRRPTDAIDVPVTVRLRGMVDGAPTGDVLANETLPAAQLPTVWSVIAVHFGTPVPVVTGGRYAVEVIGTPSDYPYIYNLGVSTQNAYAGGEAWVSRFGAPYTIAGGFVLDLWFRTYVAPWNFTGFFAPVDNPDTVNRTKAGSSIPVKFSLDGAKGPAVLANGYPKLERTACDGDATVDALEETATANTGLTYDPTTDVYTYVWKTQRSWGGTCGTLLLMLADGTTHTALFDFR